MTRPQMEQSDPSQISSEYEPLSRLSISEERHDSDHTVEDLPLLPKLVISTQPTPTVQISPPISSDSQATFLPPSEYEKAGPTLSLDVARRSSIRLLVRSSRSTPFRVIAIVVLIGIVSYASFSYLRISDPNTPSRSYFPSIENTTLVVGPRQLGPFSHGRGCTSSELLAAVAGGHLRENGRSRKINEGDLGLDFIHSNFTVSFDLDSCPPLHIFSPAEACDLLGAFGGLMVTGDSFMRHLVNAFFILLTGRNDGAVSAEQERCQGEKTFIDQPALCRLLVYKNSEDVPEKLCDGNVFIHLDEYHGYRSKEWTLPTWDALLSIVPPAKKTRSPIFFQSHGLHFGFAAPASLDSYIRPLIELYKDTFPRPLMLWGGNHAPGANKPAYYMAAQGPIPTKQYNQDIGAELDILAPGPIIGDMGMMKMVQFYNVTDGAESYDGSHYSHQVNLEKAFVILNLLDVIWGEVRDKGGLLME